MRRRDLATGWIGSLLAVTLLTTAGLGALSTTPTTVRAQSAIECAPAATPAAATPASPDASPVAESSEAAEFPADGGELTVFAAASLTEAFERIKADLEAENEGLSITHNFAGSQALVTQLSEGADADVLASASGRQMTVAVENGVVAAEPVDFTQNRLALVVPTDNPAGIDGLEDLGQDDLSLVLALPDVPVGQYAREAVCKAGADAATYGEGFVDAVVGNVVSEEDNVRAVLAKVQLGEADAGIVYTTDVTEEVAGDVTLIEIPQPVNVVARYPVAPVVGGDQALAAAFIAYLLGPDGQATLTSFGFEPPAGA